MSSKHTHTLGLGLEPAKYISNPVIVGPGIWASIHTLGYHAVTQEEQKAAADQIRVLIFNFPCLECRTDAIRSWNNDPATDHVGKDRGVFKWSVKEHNRVNLKIVPPKPTFTVEQAYEIWSGANFCHTGCSKDRPPQPQQTSSTARVTVVSPPRQRQTLQQPYVQPARGGY